MTTFEVCVAQLQALLETENSALSRMDVDAIASLTFEKNRLVNLLRSFAPGSHRPPGISDLEPRIKNLSSASDTNKVLLERAMFVQRRLMAIVAMSAQPPATGYGKLGRAIGGLAIPPCAINAST